MAKYNSTHLNLSVGGTSMKAHILDDVTLSVEIGTEESTAFGDAWASHISTDLKRAAPITVGGMCDDTAVSGPDVKFNVLGTTVAIIITWGGTKTASFSAIVQKYDRVAKMGAKTRYVATLLPTGTITEA